jgi:hypothetical protein
VCIPIITFPSAWQDTGRHEPTVSVLTSFTFRRCRKPFTPSTKTSCKTSADTSRCTAINVTEVFDMHVLTTGCITFWSDQPLAGVHARKRTVTMVTSPVSIIYLSKLGRAPSSDSPYRIVICASDLEQLNGIWTSTKPVSGGRKPRPLAPC